jgi:signal-transduction protein with cAMP-binding, CBS, and nucleotidyltransferase domain
MTHRIRDVMTRSPIAVGEDASVTQAARKMRDEDIGDVLIQRDGELTAILTDRDIAVRVVAEDRPPADTPVREVASKELLTVSPDDPVSEAVRLMRGKAIRRVAVVEGGRPVGIVSIGDLAMERDPDSALADISEAKANE